MRKKRLSVWAAIPMVVFFMSCGNASVEQKKTAPMKVQSEIVRSSSDISKKNYVGIVEEGSSVSVGFNASGTIKKVYVREGQTVKQGQLIAEIDKTQAQNMLSVAQAQMEQADDAYKRLKQLHDNHSLPEMEWVEIQSKVQQAKASLDMAKKSLDDCSIYAPENGFIGKGVMNAGEVVLPALPVAKILDIDNVKIRVCIPEKEIAAISASTSSLITLEALPDETFKGGDIEKCVDANHTTHTYDIKIHVNNAGRKLLPGMVANVEITETASCEMITVPITSVRKDASENLFVWTNKDGKVHRSVVTVGKSAGNRIIVVDGLKPGDVVITEGYQKLSEGMEVI